MITKELKPAKVFEYFEQLCQIPHGSGNVAQISDFCVKFAKEHGLKYRQDDVYNVIIWKEASKGYESHEAVMLQGHLDMVSVKEDNCKKDLAKEGLDLVIRDGYLEAEGTSLGADDGIAIAYSLALLDDDTIAHPSLIAVFTVDEEVGMDGATFLDMSDIHSHTMINLDSEEEGFFLAGCAGGATVKCHFPVTRQEKEGICVDITISGLTGGHSGQDIIFQRASANVLAGRLLHELSKQVSFDLASVQGGEKDNVIAKSSKIQLLIQESDKEKLAECIQGCEHTFRHEFEVTDTGLSIKSVISESVQTVSCLETAAAEAVCKALFLMPYGIQKMSNDIKGLVQTSLNLGVVSEINDTIALSYSVRSSVSSEKEDLIDKLCCLSELLGGKYAISGTYPAWEYRKKSALRDLTVRVYEKMYGSKPVIQTIHAGLECGIISSKIDDLDCISFGPDIIDIHTTNERMSIASVERTWNLLLEILKEMK